MKRLLCACEICVCTAYAYRPCSSSPPHAFKDLKLRSSFPFFLHPALLQHHHAANFSLYRFYPPPFSISVPMLSQSSPSSYSYSTCRTLVFIYDPNITRFCSKSWSRRDRRPCISGISLLLCGISFALPGRNPSFSVIHLEILPPESSYLFFLAGICSTLLIRRLDPLFSPTPTFGFPKMSLCAVLAP